MCESPFHGPLDCVDRTWLRLTVLGVYLKWILITQVQKSGNYQHFSLQSSLCPQVELLVFVRRTKAAIAGHVWVCILALPRTTNNVPA